MGVRFPSQTNHTSGKVVSEIAIFVSQIMCYVANGLAPKATSGFLSCPSDGKALGVSQLKK